MVSAARYGRHVILPTLLASLAGPLAAQHLPPSRFETAPPGRVIPLRMRFATADTPVIALKGHETPTAALVAGAVLGGAIAGAAGAWLGYALGNDPASDGLGQALGGVAGFLLLEPIGLGVGANVADRGRGSAGLDVLAAAGTLLVGVLPAQRTPAFAAIPVQVVVAVVVERATARRRARAAPPPG